jgi:flavin-dependent dehydrogenase
MWMGCQVVNLMQHYRYESSAVEQYLSIGGTFQKGSIKTVEEHGTHIHVTLKSGEQISCRYLVGADGSNSSVRRYLSPKQGYRVLALEQYVPKNDDYTIEIELTSAFGRGGYYFRFPNTEFDVVGYGEVNTTIEKFRQILRCKSIPEGKIRGAYVYLSNDYPRHDRILLIGDAGGFANHATCEGLYYAFLTACHAAISIVHNKPFRKVNEKVFRKELKERILTPIQFSRPGLQIVKWLCRRPGIVKRVFDGALQRELPRSLYQQESKIIPGLF